MRARRTRPDTSRFVPFDVLASIRSTAVIALVTASFSSPILVKSDAFAGISGGSASPAVPTESIVAGGVEFALPETWGRLGASAAAGTGSGERIGTVVSGVCPGGSNGPSCTGDAKVTFLAYSGKAGHELPKLAKFGKQLQARLGSKLVGYKVGDSSLEKTASGMPWLDHEFTWRSGKHVVHQRFAVYRHGDGSGVVAMVAGSADATHAKAIDAFLESGEPVTDH